MKDVTYELNMKNKEGNSPLAVAAWKDDIDIGAYLFYFSY